MRSELVDETIVGKTREGIVLDRTGVKGVKLSYIEGLCAADHEKPNEQRMTRAQYREHVIAPLIEAQQIDDGSRTPYDDRKNRYHFSTLKDSTLEIALGMTYFQAWKSDMDKSEEELRRLHELGIKVGNDKYFFLNSHSINIAGLIISSEGAGFIGERTNSQFAGQMNAVAGHIDYKENLAEFDPIVELHQELGEEFGI